MADEQEIVETDRLVVKFPHGGTFEANFDELRARVDKLVADYAELVVTPDYEKQAKRDRAYLNGLKKELDTERLRVEREYMAPLVEFRDKVKELTAPITEASARIDQQVKAFEAKRLNDKLDASRTFWSEYAPVIADAVPFELVMELHGSKWKNASVTDKHIEEQLTELVATIVRDEQMLTDLNLPYVDEAKATYFGTLDMAAAVARNKELVERAERAAALEAEKAAFAAEQEAENARAEEPETPQEAPQPAPAPVAPPAPITDVIRPDVVEPLVMEAAGLTEQQQEKHDWVFELTCTRAEAMMLADLASARGLRGNLKRVG